MDLSHRTIAVVGGDEREQEIARLAATTGATVRAYGFPVPEGGIPSVLASTSAAEALEGADYALFPIPGLSAEGALFAPECSEPIVPDRDLLARMAPGATIILGWPDDKLRAAAESLGIAFSEYEHDTELMLLRGPAIIEGALQAAIANTRVTIHDATVAVVGHGNVGRLLTRTLVQLGAHVHLFARNPVQRADAYAAGARPHPLEDLPRVAPQLDMIFSTVPSAVVSAEVLAAVPAGALVMDLAAPPGGIDLAAAESHGHRAIWARGMGRRAPVTVGRSQWSGIERRIEQIEEGRGHAG
ncbi:dipicolinate synthase subunit DpsA [Nocardioides marmoribigeumensis]|uniref:Dipicolinate synthase subunit A n=1 Tax=Nocardioides marmoribigeumensis TaxID=433649 RepID=A0ABU2BWQ6_9ACTN|nr:dipicolinate synthase subunit DpsA [Nocardioides marmoribigeumensis]MDR7362428.1 dipicolinate synthase subunit A [Nocardioides marmoribigeumensis]